MLNKAILIGRLVRDPEINYTQGTGVAVAKFTLAVDRNFKNQNGQREADFIPIVCWRKLAENVANNLSKGRLVAVSGRIQTRSYQAQDGSRRYVTEIIADEVQFLDWPKDANRPSNNPEVGTGTKPNDSGFIPVDDTDDLPF